MDHTIICANCFKELRNADGKDLEDIHTSRDGEDVCEQCCDVCNDGSGDTCNEGSDGELWNFADAVSLW